jgi:hypothetical protein
MAPTISIPISIATTCAEVRIGVRKIAQGDYLIDLGRRSCSSAMTTPRGLRFGGRAEED